MQIGLTQETIMHGLLLSEHEKWEITVNLWTKVWRTTGDGGKSVSSCALKQTANDAQNLQLNLITNKGSKDNHIHRHTQTNTHERN